MDSATWCRTPAAASAARTLRPEVSKNSSTALSSNEGELARSITTCAPTMASFSPAPVIVLMPVFGAAAIASCPFCFSFSTAFDPIKPVPPAGPTGYGLYRLIRKLGHDCIVAAPSLIPKKPGDRVKTNRRDAVGLAKLSRAGELTAVWVPDERHEAMRDLSRAREGARKDLKGKGQQVSSFMLRLGRHY